MKCFYYIKLPDGGEIKLPASFSPLSEDNKELNALVSSYYSSLENEESSEEAREALAKYFKDSKTGLSNQKLAYLINTSSEDSLVDNINLALEESGDLKDLNTSIWNKVWDKNAKFNYTTKKGISREIGFTELLERLSKPIYAKYLDKIKPVGILNIKTTNDKLTWLKELQQKSSAYETFSDIEESLYQVLSRNIRKENRKKEIFYSMSFSGNSNDSMVIHPEDSENPLIFYNENDPMSLFLGVFKEMGIVSNPIALGPAVADYNEKNKKDLKVPETDQDIIDFFIGRFEGDTYVPGTIDGLLDTKAGIKFLIEVITPIIVSSKAVVNGWDANNTTAVMINTKMLLRNLIPSKYTDTVWGEMEGLKQSYNKERTENERIWLNTNYERVSEFLRDKDYYYNKTKKKTIKNEEDSDHLVSAYNFIKNNIGLKKDLIKVETKKFSYPVYVIPTRVSLRGNKIYVSGFMHTKEGMADIYGTLSGDSIDIEYRLLEDTDSKLGIEEVTNTSPLPKKDSIVVIPGEGQDTLDPEIVKSAAMRGATISKKSEKTGKPFNYTIKAVYPGGVLLNGRKRLDSFEGWSWIRTSGDFYIDEEFTDAESDKYKELQNYRKLTKKNTSYLHIERDNIIEYNDGETNRINRVVHTKGDAVYILVKKGDGKHHITAINKNKVKSLFKPEESYNLKEGLSVAKFSEKISSGHSIKGSSFSYFTNYELADDGDYVVYNKEVHKIVDKKNKVLVKLDVDNNTYKLTTNYIQLADTKLLKEFITTKDLSSNFAIDIAEKNNTNLISYKKDENHIPATYLIPKKFDAISGTLLASGNLNIGTVGAREYYYNDDGTPKKSFPKGMIDVSEQLADRIAKRKGFVSEGLFIESSNGTIGGHYTKFNRSLYQGKFGRITKGKKRFLQAGAYITFSQSKDKTKAESRNYRINSVSKDSLILEYTRFSEKGKIISILRDVNIDHAIKHIKYLYLPYGNEKQPELESLTKDVEVVDAATKRKKLMASMSKKMKSIFNIETEILQESPKGMQSKKAWISADTAPKIVINLGNKKTTESDLIHEYLHLFLFALKYNEKSTKKTNSYEELMLEHKTNTGLESMDLSEIEEDFVTKASEFMAGREDSPTVSAKTFFAAFTGALDSLGIDDIEIDNNIFSILNKDMSEIFKNEDSDVMDSSLIMFEANFRDWVTKKIEQDDEFKMDCN